MILAVLADFGGISANSYGISSCRSHITTNGVEALKSPVFTRLIAINSPLVRPGQIKAEIVTRETAYGWRMRDLAKWEKMCGYF